MRLQDIKDGKVKITSSTSVAHNGTIYRGKKAIMELVERVLPATEPAPQRQVTSTRKRSTRTTKSTSTKKTEGSNAKDAGEPAAADSGQAPNS